MKFLLSFPILLTASNCTPPPNIYPDQPLPEECKEIVDILYDAVAENIISANEARDIASRCHGVEW